MKIGIVTQPLLNNYGGILQNFALQYVLKKFGHKPVTIEYVAHYRFLIWIIYSLKTLFLFIFGGNTKRKFMPYYRKRNHNIDTFVTLNINTTKPTKYYSKEIILDNDINGLIVGSDQVWRLEYNNDIYDMYLSFAKDIKMPKLAYAASFGVDKPSYSNKQILKCKNLIKEFSGVSVREDSAVSVCSEYYGINAIRVLDPTLLLEKEVYMNLCEDIPLSDNAYLACYILDINDKKTQYLTKLSKSLNLPVRIFSADHNAMYSVSEWLSIFRDANFIVTDSYHGTLFSIIFRKDFMVLANKSRGLARFSSILSSLSLENRLVFNTDDCSLSEIDNIDWGCVEKKLNSLQDESYRFLESNIKVC